MQIKFHLYVVINIACSKLTQSVFLRHWLLLQLGKCLKEYEGLSEKFADLYQSAFDADTHTLHTILLYPSLLLTGHTVGI